MKRLLFALMLLMSFIMSFAQTQQGYVRTIGTSKQHGIPIAGATVKLKGKTNNVASDKKGKFALPMTDMKEGDAYQLLNVVKSGYEFADKDFLSRKFAYSSKTPLEVVMISSAELAKTKHEIESRTSKTVQQGYTSQMKTLETERKAGEITIESYREKCDILQRQFENFEAIVAEMAEHYARTDYDKLDSLDVIINTCIMEGDLARADILIAEKGDLDARIVAYQRHAATNADAKAMLENLSHEIESQRTQYEKERDDIANDLYNKFAISLQRFDNKLAREHIELRAELDNSNVLWQIEAGEFISTYFAEYEKSLSYYEHALYSAISQYGENHDLVATIYNNMALDYFNNSDYEKALEYNNKALDIRLNIYGENHPSVARSYNSIGGMFQTAGNYEQALTYYNESLKIFLKTFDSEHEEVALACNNMGSAYYDLCDYAKALDFYNLSLKIFIELFGENNKNVALVYNNISSIYSSLGDYNTALDFVNKALKINLTSLGERHPAVSTCYNNMGDIYCSMEEFEEALTYLQKALDIDLGLYGYCHTNVACDYNNMGNVFIKLEDYDIGMEKLQIALDINLILYGENHPQVASTYDNIAGVYFNNNNFAIGMDFIQKGLAIRKKIFGDNHPEVATSYNNIGYAYHLMEDYDHAIEYYQKAYDILINILGAEHPKVNILIDNIENSRIEKLHKQ